MGPADLGGRENLIPKRLRGYWPGVIRRPAPQSFTTTFADAQEALSIIQVPRVSGGGWEVGPVWFTRRPDRAFHEYMSQWMDRRVEGALGGSALSFFRVTVDYPGAAAIFERP